MKTAKYVLLAGLCGVALFASRTLEVALSSRILAVAQDGASGVPVGVAAGGSGEMLWSVPVAQVVSGTWDVCFMGRSVGSATPACPRCGNVPPRISPDYSGCIRITIDGRTRFDGCVYCLVDSIAPVKS